MEFPGQISIFDGQPKSRMNVLIACEESQEVCKAFRERGHRAFSCDLQECSGGHPEWHIQGDCLSLINGNCTFQTADEHTHTQSGAWDLLIAFPPCTYLTVTGNRWFDENRYGNKAVQRKQDRRDAISFFLKFANAECQRVAIENPVGVMSTEYRKPDQIVHPYMFGDPSRKATCLWLKNLPTLNATNIVEPKINSYIGKNGKKITQSADYGWKSAKQRSKTYPGFAKAMAESWG